MRVLYSTGDDAPRWIDLPTRTLIPAHDPCGGWTVAAKVLDLKPQHMIAKRVADRVVVLTSSPFRRSDDKPNAAAAAALHDFAETQNLRGDVLVGPVLIAGIDLGNSKELDSTEFRLADLTPAMLSREGRDLWPKGLELHDRTPTDELALSPRPGPQIVTVTSMGAHKSAPDATAEVDVVLTELLSSKSVQVMNINTSLAINHAGVPIYAVTLHINVIT